MTATRRTRVVFAAHAFPRHQGDLTGGFLLRLAEALEREGVDVQAVAPAAPGLPARDRLRGVAVRRYRYAPRRPETLAYTGGMHLRAASPTGALALAGLLAAGALALRRVAAGADLVHAHWWFPGGVQARTDLPLVGRVHDQKAVEVALRALGGVPESAPHLPPPLVRRAPLETD